MEFFPDDLQVADITSIFKKEDSLNKENYRHVSILPHLEKCLKGLYRKN